MFPIHVAVGVIQNPEGMVLLSRRPEHTHQGGLWEFPGGKVERREDLSQALRREIREELGIEVLAHLPLISVLHAYPDKSVRLDVHRVTQYAGTPYGMEGQPIEWVPIEKLKNYPMPAADRPICNALVLPDSYLITGADPSDTLPFLQSLKASLERGIKLVQLRAPDLPVAEYGKLSVAAYELCQAWGATMLVNAPLELFPGLKSDGLHLTSHQLRGVSERPLPHDQWLAASCHNLAELEHAMNIGVDFCVLSPVLATASHPEAEPIGWGCFADLISDVNVPVYALGGMSTKYISQAVLSGGQGIAAIGGLWGSA